MNRMPMIGSPPWPYPEAPSDHSVPEPAPAYDAAMTKRLAFRHIAQKPAKVVHLKTLLALAVSFVHDPRLRAAIVRAIK